MEAPPFHVLAAKSYDLISHLNFTLHTPHSTLHTLPNASNGRRTVSLGKGGRTEQALGRALPSPFCVLRSPGLSAMIYAARRRRSSRSCRRRAPRPLSEVPVPSGSIYAARRRRFPGLSLGVSPPYRRGHPPVWGTGKTWRKRKKGNRVFAVKSHGFWFGWKR